MKKVEEHQKFELVNKSTINDVTNQESRDEKAILTGIERCLSASAKPFWPQMENQTEVKNSADKSSERRGEQTKTATEVYNSSWGPVLIQQQCLFLQYYILTTSILGTAHLTPVYALGSCQH